jgi:branched-chain amino acid transport system substrate-binding protein
VYVAAELAPINDTSPDVTAMTTQFGSTSTPANFWSQIGWLSAAQFVTALTENKGGGDITTPEGVVAALKGMSEYKNSMVATPLIFGSGEGHAPNLGSKVIYIKDGDWATAPGQNDQGFTIVEPPAPPES